jgi:hypothetical protein
LKIFNNKEDAYNHEIFLHDEYSVGESESFYNKAKAISSGFSMVGIKMSNISRLKIGASSKKMWESESFRVMMTIKLSTARKKYIRNNRDQILKNAKLGASKINYKINGKKISNTKKKKTIPGIIIQLLR